MVSKTIKMNELTKIYAFIDLARQVEGDIIIRKGHFAVDGKSVLGIMSLDMSTGVIIEYPENAGEVFENFLKECEC